MLYTKIKSEWFSNVRGDLLAGTVVALALIPETIAFSIIARISVLLLFLFICICFSSLIIRIIIIVLLISLCHQCG